MLGKTKKLILVLSGLFDTPSEQFEGKTPLRAAPTPALDDLVQRGSVRCVRMLPENTPFRAEHAMTSLLAPACDPDEIRRGPLLAAATEVRPEEDDVCFRCELATTDGERFLGPTESLPSSQARVLTGLLQEKLSTRRLRILPGDEKAHLLVWIRGPRDVHCFDPATVAGAKLREVLPSGEGEELLRRYIDDSLNILYEHPINRERQDSDLPPANLSWPFGNGVLPRLHSFGLEWGLSGALIAGVTEVVGLGKLLEMHVPDVPGATGRPDSAYEAKAKTATRFLDAFDFVLLHVGACAYASAKKDPTEKAYVIRDLDNRLIATLATAQARRGFRLVVTSDFVWDTEQGRPQEGPVPFLLVPCEGEGPRLPFDERACTDYDVDPVSPRDLMRLLLAPA